MTNTERSVEEMEKVKEIAREIVQVVVSEWPEYNIMTGKERNALFDGIKPIITQTLQTERQRWEEAVEAEAERIAFEITQIPRISGIGAIPETNDYANGWNDCRKKARVNVVTVLQIAHSKALTHPNNPK